MKNKRITTEVQDLLKIINRQKLPRHIAVIMDGNGRWALKRGLPRSFGHYAGMDSLKDIVNICCELKIQILTVFGFSTENWKRPQEEVDNLMNMIIEYLNKEIKELCQKEVRFNPIGMLDKLPQPTRDTLAKSAEQSRDNKGMIFNVALNYGGRSEITDAVRTIANKVETGGIRACDINTQTVTDHLYTAGQPDPDLLIRTAGEFRISNFLLWQLAHSEIWITDVLWPDFRRRHLLTALIDYQRRERRFGGL